MRVRLLVSRASLLGSWQPGDVLEVSDAEGRRMIADNQAEAISGERETTTKRRGRPRKDAAS